MPSASLPDHVWVPRYDWGNWNERWGKRLPPPPLKRKEDYNGGGKKLRRKK